MGPGTERGAPGPVLRQFHEVREDPGARYPRHGVEKPGDVLVITAGGIDHERIIENDRLAKFFTAARLRAGNDLVPGFCVIDKHRSRFQLGLQDSLNGRRTKRFRILADLQGQDIRVRMTSKTPIISAMLAYCSSTMAIPSQIMLPAMDRTVHYYTGPANHETQGTRAGARVWNVSNDRSGAIQ